MTRRCRRQRYSSRSRREQQIRHGSRGQSGLPALSVERYGRCCVLSDRRFAVLGGVHTYGHLLSLCEALTVGDGEHWELLPPMHDARSRFACAVVAGCIIVAGGHGLKSTEVFDEVLDQWLRLPCDLPIDNQLFAIGSALL
mmetsp:Transcript_38172/g.61102  ORF Transcript_38172/g.61102 Transcript_38172/m.61102 type:complete len:141 (+) Transcript_38172:648-1070(+)